MVNVHAALLLTLLAITGAAPPARAQTSAQPVTTGRIRTRDVRIATANGPVSVRGVDVKIEFPVPGRGAEQAYLIGVHDPRSGLFWWAYQLTDSTDTSGPDERLQYQGGRLFLTESKIVSFRMLNHGLSVRESTDHVATIRDGVDKARASISANLDAINRGDMRWWGPDVDLRGLGSGFFGLPGHAESYPTRLLKAAPSGANWEVTLHGADGNRIVTLDPSYALLGTRRPE